MIRLLAVLVAGASVVMFPWPLTVALALVAALFEPWTPLAIGLLSDTLYYAPYAGRVPLGVLCGAVATMGAFFVRSRLKAGMIGE